MDHPVNIGWTRSYAYANLPRSGLGNKLLVWARALVFAKLNALPLLVSSWTQLHIGPFLRGERSKRFYLRSFEHRQPVGLLRRLFISRAYRRVLEPAVRAVPGGPERFSVYEFQREPHWSDYFEGIKDHRELVRDSLHALVVERHRRELARLEAPVIGVHVRMGDYRPLAQGQDFAKVGQTRTPLRYFADVIEAVRRAHGHDLPVTLFSDGEDHELAELLALPRVTRARTRADVLDLLLLAKSRLIICSAGSSFGYWSAFLADAPIILHPDHIHEPIRSKSVDDVFYEGGPTGPDGAMPELLLANIRDIRWS